MLPEIREFIGTLKARGAEVIAISDDDETLALARTPFRLPVTVPEWVSPLISIAPGQLRDVAGPRARTWTWIGRAACAK